jgi:ABC-type oligopeptide transport system ATPase subunit
MQNGKLVEVADSAQLFSDPQQQYTRELLAAIPVPDPQRARRAA